MVAKSVKCGGDHSADCKKLRDVPAKYANCGSPHSAIYRGYPSTPKRPYKVSADKTLADTARQKQTTAAAPKGVNKQNTRGVQPSDFVSMLMRMEMHSAMMNFFKKVSSCSQV